MKNFLFFTFSILILSSCVSSKQFSEVNQSLQNAEDENRLLKEKNQELLVKNNEMKGMLDKSGNDFELLSDRLSSLEKENKSLNRENQRLKRNYSELENQLDIIKNGSSKEIGLLLDKLQKTQSDIQSREDKLRRAEFELQSKNNRLMELQDALAKKDEAVKQIKEKVMNALTGFQNNGLTVNERNGKVYVSMDERLLFKTAEWKVDENGKQALKNLSEVLAQNSDINVLVEGHTDDVPMHGSGQVKDNWDLSVMRATAVTKILLQNKSIDPKRITSAGRGEYAPLEEGKTAEVRQKNRRTEIILTPRLDEILRILERQ